MTSRKPKPAALSTPLAASLGQVETREVAKLKRNPKNARTHSPEEVDEVVASIEEFGFTIPILIDEHDLILAGHRRLSAAEKRNMSHVPVLVARGWSDARKRAYMIADNRIALNAGWDRVMLGSELGNLQLAGFNIDALGFAAGEVSALIAASLKVHGDPDDAPQPPTVPVSAEGDLWVLGPHRLLCGDATSRAAVDRLFAGARPHLMVTDPPYGVNYDPEWRERAGVGSKGMARGKVKNDDRADWREAWELFPGDVCYVWHGGLHSPAVGASLIAAKFQIRAQIVWVKSSLVMGRGAYHWQHEPLFYAQKDGRADDHWRFEETHEVAAYSVKLGATADWHGGRKQSTVWDIDLVKNDTGHGTQKPVECMRRPIVNNSKGGDLVYDPFLGSGTTLIAACMEGRICLGLELDPAYCDVIVRRWETFTGGVAVHEATKKTFEEMRGIRSANQERPKKERTAKEPAGGANHRANARGAKKIVR